MSKKILLADDSITIQKVIALTLAGEDYKITSVDNGFDAIAKAKEEKPDVILADVVMPQKNGYEVCEAIRNDPELKTTPVLLLAGTFEPFDEDVAKKAGANDYIIKPFESQALVQKIKELISARPAMPSAPVIPPKVEAPRPSIITPPTPVPSALKPPVSPPAAPSVPPKPSAPPVVAPIPPAAAMPKAPLVPQPVQIKPTPPSAAPEPEVEEDFWGTFAEEPKEKESPAEAMPAEAPAMEVSEEDVWDIGEFEEGTPEIEEVSPTAEVKEEDLWESFTFGESEEKAEEFKEAPLLEEAAENITFRTEEKEGASEIAFEEIPIESVEEPLEVLTEELGHEYVAPKVEPQPEILQGYEQTFEPEAFSREVSVAPPSPEPIPSPPPAPASMSEEQLKAALSQASKEAIERIVWEVVPDLAEMLIKEEIKRLQKKQ